MPARNAAARLPGYLESVARACDAVVALDDGSTDDTRAMLESHPLVKVVLTNPRRESFLSWHDGENRNRLLDAAAALEPGWILFLDADERLDPTDAAALRTFVAEDAIAGCAYGFRLVRMSGTATFDPDYECVFRLFAFRSGQRLPDRRLDFVPLPVSVPTRLRIKTTLRIQHLGEETEAGRQARVGKFRETDPAGAFRSYYEQLRPFSPLPHPRWQPRPPGQPILDVTPVVAAPLPSRRVRPRLICLLPGRNCEADLPGYLESVARFADAVVALDDGSTDGTADVLEGHPLVKVLLRNARRETYEGWDDAANRNRLLEAAGPLNPDWIISLDADERISPDDGSALREFIDCGEAESGYAYAFAVHRMVDDLEHYDSIEFEALRLFSYAPNQRFRNERLHLLPIPTGISHPYWLRTSLRIQHLGGLTEQRRQDRWDKYLEADPDRTWEPDYEYVRRPVGRRQNWATRPSDLSVLIGPLDFPPNEAEMAELDLNGPVLSAAILALPEGGGPHPSPRPMIDQVAATVRSLLEQESPEPIEILVVAPEPLCSELRDVCDEAKLVPVDPWISIGEARNAALRAARGDWLGYFRWDEPILPGTIAAVLEGHERGHAMVTGEVANRSNTRVGWAAYFMDHAPSLPGGPKGLVELAPAACSYAREPLLRLSGFVLDAPGHEGAIASERLVRLGHTAWRQPLPLSASEPPRAWPGWLRGCLRRGRYVGAGRGGAGSGGALLRYGPERLAALGRHARSSDPSLATEFRRAAPLVTTGVVATWMGLALAWLEPLKAPATTLWPGAARGGTWWTSRASLQRRPPSSSPEPSAKAASSAPTLASPKSSTNKSA